MVKLNSERSRIRAALVNSGKMSFPEADAKLENIAVVVDLQEAAAVCPAGQAAFLTAVATAVRCFGRVTVQGALEQPIKVSVPIGGKTLLAAASKLGAKGTDTPNGTRRILIGEGPPPADARGAFRLSGIAGRSASRPEAACSPLAAETVHWPESPQARLPSGKPFLLSRDPHELDGRSRRYPFGRQMPRSTIRPGSGRHPTICLCRSGRLGSAIWAKPSMVVDHVAVSGRIAPIALFSGLRRDRQGKLGNFDPRKARPLWRP